jgi:hypothetical protein
MTKTIKAIQVIQILAGRYAWAISVLVNFAGS